MPDDIKTAPKERFAIEQLARDIAKLLDGAVKQTAAKFGKKYGFTLFLYEFGGPEGLLNYISNCERADMIQMVELWLKKQKAGETGTLMNPPHSRN